MSATAAVVSPGGTRRRLAMRWWALLSMARKEGFCNQPRWEMPIVSVGVVATDNGVGLRSATKACDRGAATGGGRSIPCVNTGRAGRSRCPGDPKVGGLVSLGVVGVACRVTLATLHAGRRTRDVRKSASVGVDVNLGLSSASTMIRNSHQGVCSVRRGRATKAKRMSFARGGGEKLTFSLDVSSDSFEVSFSLLSGLMKCGSRIACGGVGGGRVLRGRVFRITVEPGDDQGVGLASGALGLAGSASGAGLGVTVLKEKGTSSVVRNGRISSAVRSDSRPEGRRT